MGLTAQLVPNPLAHTDFTRSGWICHGKPGVWHNMGLQGVFQGRVKDTGTFLGNRTKENEKHNVEELAVREKQVTGNK